MANKNVYRWSCQKCEQPLDIGRPLSSTTSPKLDSSFVVLQRERGSGKPSGKEEQEGGKSRKVVKSPAGKTRVNKGLNPVDESFVVLQGDAGGETSSLLPTTVVQADAMCRVFEFASQHTQVDHPLCTSCCKEIENDLNSQIREAEEDIFAYETCLKQWEQEAEEVEPLEQLEKSLEEAQRVEKVLAAELKAVLEETSRAEATAMEADLQAEKLERMKEEYWQSWNEFSHSLHRHQESRDSVLSQLAVGSQQLESLRARNVVNDAFHIWFEGDFGTINGFRLGRLPKQPVEWEELNAAWGQACLLLSTMAQTCRLSFKYQILPMGSYPRIAEGKSCYDLFGPVNLFWSARYDKAMAMFLCCLQEFAEFAHAKDRAAGASSAQSFQLPYKIEGDRVNSFSIKQAFNADERWTKALKYMLCNLKWAAAWFVKKVPVRG